MFDDVDEYVFDTNAQMILQYNGDADVPANLMHFIVECLNGKKPNISASITSVGFDGTGDDAKFHITYNDVEYYFDIRGWGYLTGRCKLNPNDAAKIQDSIGYYMVAQMGGYV